MVFILKVKSLTSTENVVGQQITLSFSWRSTARYWLHTTFVQQYSQANSIFHRSISTLINSSHLTLPLPISFLLVLAALSSAQRRSSPSCLTMRRSFCSNCHVWGDGSTQYVCWQHQLRNPLAGTLVRVYEDFMEIFNHRAILFASVQLSRALELGSPGWQLSCAVHLVCHLLNGVSQGTMSFLRIWFSLFKSVHHKQALHSELKPIHTSGKL